MQHPRLLPGARGSSDRGISSGNDASISIPTPLQLQAIPEREAEALAWGYGLPPADHLIAARAVWWRLLSQGVTLPAEPGVIMIRGGRHER